MWNIDYLKKYNWPNLIVECPTGKFGNNCNNTCSANCKDNLKKCDVTSGDCEGGCLDGWHGKHCDRSTNVSQTVYLLNLLTLYNYIFA